MIIVYTTCKNKKEAEKIGLAILKKRLAACAVVLPRATSLYFWPPEKNKIIKSPESILLLKTDKRKYPKIARVIKKLHSYTIPCILEIPVARLNREYQKWLEAELI